MNGKCYIEKSAFDYISYRTTKVLYDQHDDEITSIREKWKLCKKNKEKLWKSISKKDSMGDKEKYNWKKLLVNAGDLGIDFKKEDKPEYCRQGRGDTIPFFKVSDFILLFKGRMGLGSGSDGGIRIWNEFFSGMDGRSRVNFALEVEGIVERLGEEEEEEYEEEEEKEHSSKRKRKEQTHFVARITEETTTYNIPKEFMDAFEMLQDKVEDLEERLETYEDFTSRLEDLEETFAKSKMRRVQLMRK